MWTESKTLVHSNQRLNVQLIVKELNMNREIVRQISSENLEKKKSLKMILQILTGISFDILIFDNGGSLLGLIV